MPRPPTADRVTREPAPTRRAPDVQLVAGPRARPAHHHPNAAPVPGAVTPTGALRLQRGAGNAAVARLVTAHRAQPALRAPRRSTVTTMVARVGGVGSGAASAVQRLAPGAPAAGRTPTTDPRFAALTRDIDSKRTLLAAHPPPAAEAAAVDNAAVAPAEDKLAQAKAAQAGQMAAAKSGEFDKAGFVKAVNQAMSAQAPKNLDEADAFATSGKADAVKGTVSGHVASSKESAAGPLKQATAATPDTARAVGKPVTELAPDRPPAMPATPDPAKAVPERLPPAATDLAAGPKQVGDQMAEANVTERQLATSNEPEFTSALGAKQAGEAHAAAASPALRAAESATLTAAKGQATTGGAAAMASMTTARTTAGGQVARGKSGAKAENEKKRAAVAADMQGIFDKTKTETEGILTGLDTEVDAKFAAEEGEARRAFTADHKRRMDEYKSKRYAGLAGAALWTRDLFMSLPAEANREFDLAKASYVTKMQTIISGIADLIGKRLAEAKKRIADGKAQLQVKVDSLPKDLRAFGADQAKGFGAQFEELTESVTAKGSDLVSALAEKYSEAVGAVDEEIAAEKDKNKGLVDKAQEAVGGAIKTIMQLKDLLMGVLAKAAGAVAAIISDPVKFLGSLVAAVGAGLRGFLANIGTHLTKGLIGWLMGALAATGLALPAKWDLQGILGMLASMFGITWAAIRAQIVAAGVPEAVMGKVEAGVGIAKKLISSGVSGIVEELMAILGDVRENLFSKIKDFLIPAVLTAGITWIVSLLNPASAFVKAAKAIVDFVSFIMERGAQIAAFVNSVLDAVIAIAGGGGGGVAGLIEKALAGSIPVLIGALASLLGLGGVATAVQKFFTALQAPMRKAVAFVVKPMVAFGKKLWSKMKRGAAKLKAKAKVAVKKIKAKAKKAWSKVRRRRNPQRGHHRNRSSNKAKIAASAARAGYAALSRGVHPNGSNSALQGVLTRFRNQGVKSLRIVGSDSIQVTAQLTKGSGRLYINPLYRRLADLDPKSGERERVPMTKKEATDSFKTWARGTFIVDDSLGVELRGMRSSDKHPGRQMALRTMEGAHAEEQVIMAFEEIYNQERTRKTTMRISLNIDVSSSSCPRCASHAARFVAQMKADGCTVMASARFAKLYHGPQPETGPRADYAPTELPDEAALISLIYGEAVFSRSKAREHGRKPGSPTKEMAVIPSGKEVGNLGIAILANAGFNVEVLKLENLPGELADDKKSTGNFKADRAKLQAEKLENALKKVKSQLMDRVVT